MNSKMSIERIADRLDTLAEITPDKSKMAIERIASALESLASTTHTEGTSSLERIADAVEQYSGGGGGGSSDLSTARVTFNNSAGAQFLLSVARDDGDESASMPTIDAVSGIADAILYKGMAYGLILDEGVNVTTTGAVEYDEGLLIITGDCTITIS